MSKTWNRALSIVAEVGGCVGLYFAWVMLTIVPGTPGEPYLNWARVAYGLVPALLAACFLTLAGWLWKRSGGLASTTSYVQKAFLVALVAVPLFFESLYIYARLRGWTE